MTDWSEQPEFEEPPAGEAPSVIAEVLAHSAAPPMEDSILDNPFPTVIPAEVAEPDQLISAAGVAMPVPQSGPQRIPGGLPLVLSPLSYYAAYAPWAIAFAALIPLPTRISLSVTGSSS